MWELCHKHSFYAIDKCTDGKQHFFIRTCDVNKKDQCIWIDGKRSTEERVIELWGGKTLNLNKNNFIHEWYRLLRKEEIDLLIAKQPKNYSQLLKLDNNDIPIANQYE